MNTVIINLMPHQIGSMVLARLNGTADTPENTRLVTMADLLHLYGVDAADIERLQHGCKVAACSNQITAVSRLFS